MERGFYLFWGGLEVRDIKKKGNAFALKKALRTFFYGTQYIWMETPR